MTKASTAIGISPKIKSIVAEKARLNRLTSKETVLMGMRAIDLLNDEQRQELADQVHQEQVSGEI